jgi:hypothetical protein
MRRLILTFLLVLLPLQFAQAAMCAYYCGDDLPLSTQQQDNSPSDMALVADDQPTHPLYGSSHRCGFCNLAQAKFIQEATPVLTAASTPQPYLPDPIAYQSYIPHGLDRPNWTPFA